jgi:hypothetical protein
VVREPSCFLSVMWHAEGLYGLGVQGVGALLLLGVYFFSDRCGSSVTQDF